jgi:hypothetical protein
MTAIDGNILDGVSAHPTLDRLGILRRDRPSFTPLEFAG